MHLEKYSSEFYFMFSSMKEVDWGDKSIARNYLERYWLNRKFYNENWRNLFKSVFDLDKRLPDMIFKKDFEYITLLGGVMFEQTDFERFAKCIKEVGDKEFKIIQDTFGMDHEDKKTSFKMKYPVTIEWNELISGNFISTFLFEVPENNYYILGDSGQWGMYVANDYIDVQVNPAGTPIRIIGFDPKYRMIFREAFEIPKGTYCENVDYIPEEERPNLKEWVPKKYKK